MLPRVPVRQWVLSLPYRLRYLLAWGSLRSTLLTVEGMKRVEQTLGGASLRSGRAGRDGDDSDGPPAWHRRGSGLVSKACQVCVSNIS